MGVVSKKQVNDVLENILNNKGTPRLELAYRVGRKSNLGPGATLVNFANYQDNEKVLQNRPHNVVFSIQDNCTPSTCKEIQMVEDKYIKFALNLPKM